MSEVYLFIIFSLILSLAIDLIYGELPTKIHPVVIIGKIIEFFKSKFITIKNRWSGFLTTLFTILISCMLLLIIMLISSINDYLFIFILLYYHQHIQ